MSIWSRVGGSGLRNCIRSNAHASTGWIGHQPIGNVQRFLRPHISSRSNSGAGVHDWPTNDTAAIRSSENVYIIINVTISNSTLFHLAHERWFCFFFSLSKMLIRRQSRVCAVEFGVRFACGFVQFSLLLFRICCGISATVYAFWSCATRDFGSCGRTHTSIHRSHTNWLFGCGWFLFHAHARSNLLRWACIGLFVVAVVVVHRWNRVRHRCFCYIHCLCCACMLWLLLLCACYYCCLPFIASQRVGVYARLPPPSSSLSFINWSRWILSLKREPNNFHKQLVDSKFIVNIIRSDCV